MDAAVVGERAHGVEFKFEPLLRTPEFHIPEGLPGVPEVVLWKLESQIHLIVSPGSMVMRAGEKYSPPVPT